MVLALAWLTLLSPAAAFCGQHSPREELQHRLEAQRSAVQSGNLDAIVATSRAAAALGLREVAEWRLRQTAYVQAIALCRNSLLLEDSDETKTILSSAQARVKTRQQETAQDTDGIDLAATPNAAVIYRAKLTPAEARDGQLREKRLRHILGAVYNDWGTAEARQEQFLSAMVHFQEAERWDTSIPGLMRNLGLSAAKVEDNREAVRALKVAVKTDPKDTASRSMLSVSLFALGDYAGAAKSFEMVRDAALADPEMAYAWAFSLSRANRLKQAGWVLDKLSARPLSAEMLVLVGKIYNDIGDYSHALGSFQNASRQDPAIKQAHGGAGVALIRLNRPSDAVPELEAELKLNPRDPDSQYQLAYARLQLSEKDQAIQLLRALIAEYPDHARARYQLGKILLDAKQTDEAIENLRIAAQLDPDSAYIHYQLQLAYRQAGMSGEADRELKVYRQIKDRDRQRISTPGDKSIQTESNSD